MTPKISIQSLPIISFIRDTKKYIYTLLHIKKYITKSMLYSSKVTTKPFLFLLFLGRSQNFHCRVVSSDCFWFAVVRGQGRFIIHIRWPILSTCQSETSYFALLLSQHNISSAVQMLTKMWFHGENKQLKQTAASVGREDAAKTMRYDTKNIYTIATRNFIDQRHIKVYLHSTT